MGRVHDPISAREAEKAGLGFESRPFQFLAHSIWAQIFAPRQFCRNKKSERLGESGVVKATGRTVLHLQVLHRTALFIKQ